MLLLLLLVVVVVLLLLKALKIQAEIEDPEEYADILEDMKEGACNQIDGIQGRAGRVVSSLRVPQWCP